MTAPDIFVMAMATIGIGLFVYVACIEVRHRLKNKRERDREWQDRYVEDLEDAEYNAPGMYTDRLKIEREKLERMK